MMSARPFRDARPPFALTADGPCARPIEVIQLADAQSVLQQLRQRNPDIVAAVVASTDGLAVHEDVAGGTDAEALAAMGSDIVLRAARMAEDVGQGAAQQVLVQSGGGYVVASRVGDDFCLLVAAKVEASLGLLLISVRKAAAELAADLG
jgi:predicted regulator of Ras-like GTPase activity (Roadblock/LC7/MglB family)